MAALKIKVGERVLPAYPTLGAMLRFKEETGRESSTIDGTADSDLITWLWCCVAGACARAHTPFDMPLMEFADALDMTTMQEWLTDQIPADAPAPAEKKSRRK